jgi:cephalosporin hydroxylase
MDVRAALDDAFSVGMFQNVQEISQFAEFVAARNLRNVVEIGTLQGGSAILWHHLSSGKVVTIDKPAGRFGGADWGYTLDKCVERSEGLTLEYPRIVPVLGDSLDLATAHRVQEILKGEPVDLLFIDGDHTRNGVQGDYNMYQALVPVGGIVAFHDVADTEMHTRDGVEVPQFFRDLQATGLETKVWRHDGTPWGGIGAILK